MPLSSSEAGVPFPISPHTLRHTFVTLSLDAGVSLRDAAVVAAMSALAARLTKST